eukprot:1395087-Amphidinium_carterae.1
MSSLHKLHQFGTREPINNTIFIFGSIAFLLKALILYRTSARNWGVGGPEDETSTRGKQKN